LSFKLGDAANEEHNNEPTKPAGRSLNAAFSPV
jgi:hypothetical protein